LSVAARFAIVGFIVTFVVGGVGGLILGLRAYPPTAWFAVLEVALPVGIVGAMVGVAVGLVVALVHAIQHQ
jgi:hypothetical protein